MSERVWRALDEMPVRSGVRAAWNEAVGDAGFHALAPFLKVGANLATLHPCPEPGDDGCPRGVVVHGPGDIVAVCRRRPRSCATLHLTRDDIVVWRFDVRALARDVRALLALGGDGPAPIEGVPRTHVLGTYRPLAGVEARFYLALPEDRDECDAIVERLVVREARPFVLVLLTNERFSPAAGERMRACAAATVALADIVSLDGTSGLVAEPQADGVLAKFRSGLAHAVSAKAKHEMAFFETPADARWDDLVVRFVDGHTVSVRVGEAKGRFNYTQLGMASRKNGQPTKQWDLLRAFAEEHGVLTWESRHASRVLQKRREVLAQDLGAFFRIDGDPIEFVAGNKGWRVRFTLVGEE
jgi:hypothetical protein